MLSFLSVIYFLIVIGFLAASYYPLLKQKFLSHATADEKKIRSVFFFFTTSPLWFTRTDPSESLPPVCPPTLEVYGNKGVRVLDYRWEGEEDSLTIVSRLI